MFNRQAYRPVQDAPFFTMNADVMRLIFSMLDIKDLAAVAQVCLEFEKRAKQTPTHALIDIETRSTNHNGDRVKKIKTHKVSGTYAAVSAALNKRHAAEAQKEQLDDSYCVITDMQAPSCRIFAGLFNLSASSIAALGGHVIAGSAAMGSAATAGLTLGGFGGVCLFGCAVTETCVAVNKKIRQQHKDYRRERNKLEYPKVVVMEDPVAEREERLAPDREPFEYGYNPMVNHYIHMGMI